MNSQRTMPPDADSRHILFVNPYLTNYHTEAGAWARQLVADLRAAGAAVSTIPCFSSDEARGATQGRRYSSHGRKLKQWLPKKIVVYLIEVRLILTAVRNLVNCSWIAWRRHRRNVPGVVYARAYEYDLTSRVIASILKRPLVLEVHSPFYLERCFRGLRESRLIRRFDLSLWKRAALIRVVSRPVLKILTDEGLASSHVRFIPYGVDALERDSPAATATDPMLEIVFVGSFYPWHDLDSLVDAFVAARGEVENLRLTVIGDGAARATSEAKVRRLGLEHAIDFVGWLSKDEVLERLARADIAVAPYLRLEPFYYDPAKVLEYMSAGLPIIASDIPRIAEMLDFGRAGLLVPPGDVAALTNSLVTLAKDEPLRRRLGSAAQDIIKQGYARATIAEQVVSLCNEAAGDC